MGRPSVHNTLLLYGAFLLLYEQVDLDYVVEIFKESPEEIYSFLVRCNNTPDTDIVSCWKALHQAKALVDVGSDPAIEPTFDVEMAAHYAQAATSLCRASSFSSKRPSSCFPTRHASGLT
mmetsp:Transcript_49960/g.104265  ORF Transcript_49960/g.104265 Transcript_49960/m.104265 type:complete len:120 (-) Transcript_49960:83-442(-)